MAIEQAAPQFTEQSAADVQPARVKPALDRVVLLAGLITSAGACAMVYAAMRNGWNMLSYYTSQDLPIFVPIGAVLAGVVAAVGYLLAGVIRRPLNSAGLTLVIILMHLATFAAAHYAEYRAVYQDWPKGTADSFFTYFDGQTRGYYFTPGEPIGQWGYWLRAYEVAGFLFGGFLGALMVAVLLGSFFDTFDPARRSAPAGDPPESSDGPADESPGCRDDDAAPAP